MDVELNCHSRQTETGQVVCEQTDKVTIILSARWVWCCVFQSLPWTVDLQMFFSGDGSLFETPHASTSVLYVWTSLFQPLFTDLSEALMESTDQNPQLRAPACFISRGSHITRLCTAIYFHSWGLWSATDIRKRGSQTVFFQATLKRGAGSPWRNHW